MLKEKSAVLALLGIGALIALVILLRRNSKGATNSVTEEVSNPYPNAQPLPDVPLGKAGFALTYNTRPYGATLDGSQTGSVVAQPSAAGTPESCVCASPAGQLVVQNQVPQTVYDAAMKNFQNFVNYATVAPTQAFHF